MKCKLSFTRHAEKDLEKISKRDARLILEHCISLEQGDTSLNIKRLHPPLSGYRLRVGTYRILYIHEENARITVHAIKHRKDAYK